MTGWPGAGGWPGTGGGSGATGSALAWIAAARAPAPMTAAATAIRTTRLSEEVCPLMCGVCASC